MKYEGLSDYELECLKTPMKDLTRESLQVAISAKDKVNSNIQRENALYVRKPVSKVYLVSDSIDPIINQANGKAYDSKSKYYADLKASGHVVVESGMDKPREIRGDFDARKDVARALNQLGY